MSKLKAGQVAVWATRTLMDLVGPYAQSPECPLEKWFRDAKIYELFEGTAEIQKLVISRMQVADYEERLRAAADIASVAARRRRGRAATQCAPAAASSPRPSARARRPGSNLGGGGALALARPPLGDRPSPGGQPPADARGAGDQRRAARRRRRRRHPLRLARRLRRRGPRALRPRGDRAGAGRRRPRRPPWRAPPHLRLPPGRGDRGPGQRRHAGGARGDHHRRRDRPALGSARDRGRRRPRRRADRPRRQRLGDAACWPAASARTSTSRPCCATRRPTRSGRSPWSAPRWRSWPSTGGSPTRSPASRSPA